MQIEGYPLVGLQMMPATSRRGAQLVGIIAREGLLVSAAEDILEVVVGCAAQLVAGQRLPVEAELLHRGQAIPVVWNAHVTRFNAPRLAIHLELVECSAAALQLCQLLAGQLVHSAEWLETVADVDSGPRPLILRLLWVLTNRFSLLYALRFVAALFLDRIYCTCFTVGLIITTFALYTVFGILIQ